ncbi:hypothetical protein BpHYR1_026939 [Brachionus plicatilis]|uniref:Uncharacterized protein n=1 Tax=Brachionus plicatilis TaxID=10195 RepID=A0A3M7PA87_BRAPC|nr:hypothetical protein BpHYR1_026939 [Brachionus plicatilis]
MLNNHIRTSLMFYNNKKQSLMHKIGAYVEEYSDDLKPISLILVKLKPDYYRNFCEILESNHNKRKEEEEEIKEVFFPTLYFSAVLLDRKKLRTRALQVDTFLRTSNQFIKNSQKIQDQLGIIGGVYVSILSKSLLKLFELMIKSTKEMNHIKCFVKILIMPSILLREFDFHLNGMINVTFKNSEILNVLNSIID